MSTVNMDEELELFEDDRGGFDGGPKKRVSGLRAAIAVLLLILTALFAWWLISLNGIFKDISEEDETKNTRPAGSLPKYEVSTTPSNAAGEAKERNSEPRAPSEERGAEPNAGNKYWSPNSNSSSAQPAGRPSANGASTGTPPLTPQQRAVLARLGVTDAERNATPQSAVAESEKPVVPSESSTALAGRYSSARLPKAMAGYMANQHMIVPSGMMIPCGTWSELDTTVPGRVACRTTREVWSADHAVKLIDKGAYVEGEVSGGISRGQARVFVLWTRGRNTDGVWFYLDSPGTGRLGSAGVPGQVDTHFWERFGDAMAISLFSDASSAAFQSIINALNSNNTDTGNTVNLDNSEQTSDSLAREALQESLSIPPTLYAAQGEYVQIWVARDIDFSSVYDLKVK